MKGLLLAPLLVLQLASCSLRNPNPEEEALLPGEVRSLQAARNAIAIGKSTRAEVRAALGQAAEVPFDSGYAVWVYREKPLEKKQETDKQKALPRAELVLLFAPSGILAKARTR